MKPKVYEVKDKMQLIFAITNIMRNPLEYTDCYINMNDIDLELFAKVLSKTNSFVKFHYKFLSNHTVWTNGNLSALSTQSRNVNGWTYSTASTDIYNQSGHDFLDDWNKWRAGLSCKTITKTFVLEPAYDADKFTKLLRNRIKVIDNPTQFKYNSSEDLSCKDHIVYLKQESTFKILDLAYEILKYSGLDMDIGRYIFIFHVNKIMHVMSQESIKSIDYFDNNTLRINNQYLYKIK